MCEQIQREGVTQGIALDGKRLQDWCGETGKPGEREHEGSRAVAREFGFSENSTSSMVGSKDSWR